MFDFIALAQQCAPNVSPQTMAAVVRVESTYNPYAIGVVGGRLVRQPANKDEAVATAKALAAAGWNFSLGIAQVNQANLPKFSVSYDDAFEPCRNMQMGSQILADCYARALKRTPGDEQAALRASFSCYYSGNFTRGFVPDKPGEPSYVQKVVAQAGAPVKAIPVVPTVQPAEGKASVPARAATAAVPAVAAPVPQPASVSEPSMVIDGDMMPTPAANAAAAEPVRLKRAGASEAAPDPAPKVPAPEAAPQAPSSLVF